MKNTLIVLSFALAACGGDTLDMPHDDAVRIIADTAHYPTGQSSRGLTLRKETTFNQNAIDADAWFLEQVAERTYACVGATFDPPPLVIIVPRGTVPRNNGGMYYLNPRLIVMDEDHWIIIWQHEVVHDALRTESHEPREVFQRCGPFGL